MKIFIDIDETICLNNDDRDYNKAKPIKKNIAKMNALLILDIILHTGLQEELEQG